MSLFGLLNQNSGRFAERTLRVQEIAQRDNVMDVRPSAVEGVGGCTNKVATTVRIHVLTDFEARSPNEGAHIHFGSFMHIFRNSTFLHTLPEANVHSS